MISIKERAKDVKLIAQCVIKANAQFRSFRITGEPSLHISYKEPLWLVPFTNSAAKSFWDKNYYMFYYPVNCNIFFCRRYGNRTPEDMYYGRVFPFEEGLVFNSLDNIYELHTDEQGSYVKITYKQALLTEDEARKDFQSEYYIDRKWVLKSLKLVEVHGCMLRWIATMLADTGEKFRISVDPLGHSFVSEHDGEIADFKGKKPDENKNYFSMNDASDCLLYSNLVLMKYRNGSVEISNLSNAQKLPTKFFKRIPIHADY